MHSPDRRGARCLAAERGEIVLPDETGGRSVHCPHIERIGNVPARCRPERIGSLPVQDSIGVPTAGCAEPSVETGRCLETAEDCDLRAELAVQRLLDPDRIGGDRDTEADHLTGGVHPAVGSPRNRGVDRAGQPE